MDIDFSKMDGLKPGEASEEARRYRRLEKRGEDDRWREDVLRQQGENIRSSEALRAEILRGAKAGAPVGELYEKAIRCIALMTGDTVFEREARRVL